MVKGFSQFIFPFVDICLCLWRNVLLSLAPVFSRHVNWRPISGTIVSSSTTKKEIRYESGKQDYRQNRVCPKIRCNYNVDGKEYSNDFVTDKEMPTEQDAAETALEQFFRGKE